MNNGVLFLESQPRIYDFFPNRRDKISSFINLKYSCDCSSIELVSIVIIILTCWSCSKAIRLSSRSFHSFWICPLDSLNFFKFLDHRIRFIVGAPFPFLLSFLEVCLDLIALPHIICLPSIPCLAPTLAHS